MDNPTTWLDLVQTLGLPIVMALYAVWSFQTERWVSGATYRQAVAEKAAAEKKLNDQSIIWQEVALRGLFSARRAAKVTGRALEKLPGIEADWDLQAGPLE